ncbi:hypothetical protein HZS_6406 [Henneguya salminicola]|nr:hypothetical protein HZS_6406 [Henneguya salminicola]
MKLNNYQMQGNDLDSELLYIQGLYMTANRVEPRQVYVHVTNATNTSNIKFVFDAVSDIILKKSLKETGLIF